MFPTLQFLTNADVNAKGLLNVTSTFEGIR